MILYTEKQLQTAYNIDRKKRMKLGINTTTIDEYRPIYEEILNLVFDDFFGTNQFPPIDEENH